MNRRIRPELQVTSTECGLVCTAMILRSLGCTDTTTALREELDLGRDGATLSQLREVFERRDVPVKLYRASSCGLLALDGPVVVFWRDYHFVVLEKLSDAHAVIVDPAIGRRKISREEFDDSFSNLALHPSQTAAQSLYAEDGRKRDSTLRRLFATGARRARTSLLLLLACAIASYAGTLALPILTQRFIDSALSHPQQALTNTWLPLVLAVCITTLMLAGFLRSIFSARATVTLGRHASEKVLAHLLRLPLRFFDTRQPGELAYRLNGLSAIRDILSGQVITGAFEIGASLVFLGYIFHTSPLLGWVACGLVTLVLVLLFSTRRLVYVALQNEMIQTGKSQTQQLEAIQSILTIKAEGSARFFLSRWRKENELALGYLAARTRLQGAIGALVSGVQLGAPLVILMIGLNAWSNGELTVGKVVAAQAMSISLFASASSIFGSVTQMMTAIQYARRLEDILDSDIEQAGSRKVDSWAPLTLRDVSFRYSKDAPDVLCEVNLEVGPGEKIAIVGPTGSGKSTLARLILGLYEPTRGEICMNHQPLGELDSETLLRDIAFVPQGITLETMSIRRNIEMGSTVTDADLRTACDRACISQDIERLPMGYETLVSNLGDNFSGGQKQRVGIARALVKSPSLLILDEATSSLDNPTESAIMASISTMNCAAVIIAHRLASVIAADRIYVMHQGSIAEVGTHSELLAARGVYWNLFGQQMGSVHDAV